MMASWVPPATLLGRRGFLIAAGAFVGSLGIEPAFAMVPDAEDFVSQLGAQVVAILSDDAVSGVDKLAQLKLVLDDATNLDLMAKLVLGRYWRSASEQERTDYQMVFRQMVMQTMANRLNDYGGETIEVIGSQELNKRDAMVHTMINRPGGAPSYKVDWRVRTNDGQQAIIDVVAENISLVVSQRSEIGNIVARDGMNGLIDTIRRRVENK